MKPGDRVRLVSMKEIEAIAKQTFPGVTVDAEGNHWATVFICGLKQARRLVRKLVKPPVNPMVYNEYEPSKERLAHDAEN